MHPKLRAFHDQLTILFNEMDDYLEDRYAGRYRLHPQRPERGSTASKSQDGLFNIGAQFTAGYNSEYGRGYAIDLKIATLDTVSFQASAEIEADIVRELRAKLTLHFPDRQLHLVHDKFGLKIIGDFSLGEL